MYAKKPHLTESYAFSKLALKTKHGFFLDFASCTTLLAINSPPNIFLLPMKVDCLVSIMLHTTLLILLAKIFAIILYRRQLREMGLYSPWPCGFSFFVIRVKNESLDPLGNH